MNTQDYEAKYGEMDTGIDMTAASAGEDDPEQGLDQLQDLDQGLGQHFLITDTSGSLLPLKGTSTSSNSTPKVYTAHVFFEFSKPILFYKALIMVHRLSGLPKVGLLPSHYPPLGDW